MTRLGLPLGIGTILASLTLPAMAEVSAAMRTNIPDAAYVARYSPADRAAAAQAALLLSALPHMGASVSLTPDQPYAADGSALNFWKPSFVLGTRDGGEAGVNFWGVHDEGHINVAFTPEDTRTRLIDCRFLSDAPITYKVYTGGGDKPLVEQPVTLVAHHLLVAVSVEQANRPILVEFWPTPTPQVVGFFGCDLAAMD